MIRFDSDYTEGAHEAVLQKLIETNMEQTEGYGCDPYCEAAREKIRQLCDKPEADVHFLMGGTQANTTVIASVLRPYQGVIAADTGHINVHEAGAIESSGHKVIALPSEDGKITAEQVEQCFWAHVQDESREHMVRPGMVYISQPTELGTTYMLRELQALYEICSRNGLILFIDGARLGYGLRAADCDITLPDLAGNCDVFYIGGTKMGALFGEAVVITKPSLRVDFRYMIKQRGGMLAKGRLLGLQFLALLENDLYWDLAKNANQMADKIRETLRAYNIPSLVENCTNQIFPILPDECIQTLSESFAFSCQKRIDETHSAIRLCTSWATTREQVDSLCEALRTISVSLSTSPAESEEKQKRTWKTGLQALRAKFLRSPSSGDSQK